MHPVVNRKIVGSIPMHPVMSKVFFTSDTHFGHANIIKFSNRPFASVDEMDATLIDNINKVVGPNDVLYHLGDWSFKDPVPYRQRIRCDNVHLILGNHDHKRLNRLYAAGFKSIDSQLEIKVDGNDITLNHYAMRCWNKSHRGAWHLYGHSHGSLPDDPNSLSFDCGVDCWDYKPIGIEQVREVMSRKTFLPIDHHGKRDFEQCRR